MSQVAAGSQESSRQSQSCRSRGICRVCHRECALNPTSGNIRAHNRCLGSRRAPNENNQQPPPADRADSYRDFTSTEDLKSAIKLTSTRTLTHIPKAARPQAASKFTDLLKKVNDAPSNNRSWHNLLLFGNACLAVPPRRDKSLATHVIRAINAFPRDDNLVRLPPRATNTRRANANNRTPDTSKIRAQISKKIEEGNTIGALRLITSEDTIAPKDVSTAQALKDKHPPRAPSTNIDLPDIAAGEEHLTLQDADVYKAAMSFPQGSAGGFTGLRPQHLKQILNPALGEVSERLLSELTKFSNLCLAGGVPEAIRPFFFGASLCALRKKDGGIRPIAVGNTLRRLVAKAAVRRVSQEAAAMLKPTQLGFGVQQGCEAAAHAARVYIKNMSYEKALVKLDFANAFNSVRRDAALQAVYRNFPSLYPFIESCYSVTSKLLFGDHEIDSCEGVQQGDPLAPFLFCLVIKEVTEALSSELNIWFLDDGTLAGTTESLLEDISKIKDMGESLGLSLNPSKCEIVSTNQQLIQNISTVLPGARAIDPANSTLLGAPLGSNAIDLVLGKKVSDLRTMESRMKDIDTHDAFYLLTRCLSTPKLTYFLRCSPAFSSPKLKEYDSLLKAMLESVLNLSLDDGQWLQASLPVRLGGLGVRRSSQIALPAFLSSSIASNELIRQILPDTLSDSAGIEDPSYVSAITEWETLAAPAPNPSAALAHKQSSWDSPIAEKVLANMLRAATSDREIARLQAVSAPHSGDFLQTVPISAMGTRLDPKTLRIAVALRLAAPIHTEYMCICGEVQADQYGLHGLNCSKTKGWHARHNEVNDIIKRTLATAGCPAEREPRSLAANNTHNPANRPDGITIYPWKNGKLLAWDYTCVSTLADTYIHHSVGRQGGAADHREEYKISKYRDISQQYQFVPVGSETLGSWGKNATRFLKELGSRLIDTTRDPRAATFMFQRLSVAIQRGNACCILGSRPASEELEEIHHL